VHDPPKRTARLKIIGWSVSDDWNNVVANQVASALWLRNSDAEKTEKQRRAAIAALVGIAPQDDPKPLGTPEEEFEVTELKKNALDPTRQFVFQ
jgi:hypothetical protein